MIYITSDTHFGHQKLVEHGWRPEGHEEMIMDETNVAGFQHGDSLIHLGDVYAGEGNLGEAYSKEYLRLLHSLGVSPVLVQGNHDSKRSRKLMNMGWIFTVNSMCMTYDKSTILFTHEPVIGLHLPDGIDYNIHGHLHDLDGHRGPIERDGHHILISIELMQYKPISLERLLEIGSTPKWFPEENRFWRAE